MTAIINALAQFKSIGADVKTQIIAGYTCGKVKVDECEATEAVYRHPFGEVDFLDMVLVARHVGKVETLRCMVNDSYQLANKRGMAVTLTPESYLHAVKQRGYRPEVDCIFSPLSKEEGLEYGRISLLFDGRSATTIYEQDGDIATCAILVNNIVKARHCK